MGRRILIDLTDYRAFRRTHGRLTGIQRVIFEVGRRIQADGDADVVAFYYDRHADTFYVAEPDLLQPEPAPEPGTDMRPPAPAAFRSRARAGVLRLARAGWRRSAPVRRLLGRFAATRRAYAAARRAIEGGPKLEPIAFSEQDVVLVLGTVWESPDLLSRLALEREQMGFSVITMVYDLIPVEFPQFVFPQTVSEFVAYLTKVLALSSRIFVISEATRSGLSSWCAEHGITAPAIDVAYLGDDFARPPAARRPVELPDGDFILAVSTIEPRKNYYVLYQAVKEAELRGLAIPRIVIVGRPGWRTTDLQELLRNDVTIHDRVVWLDAVGDTELAWLYENCLFTVFPSIAEGWGLPISESISFGKFCISSGESSMPEIAGDLIDYVSPWDSAGWAEEIRRYAAEPALLREREQRIRSEYRPRTWDETAQVVLRAARG